MNSQLKTYLMISLLALTLTGAAVYGSDPALAQAHNFRDDSLVKKLSQRFGVGEDEVEQVIEEFRQERREEHQQWLYAGLTQAEVGGEITEEQRDLILKKYEEIRQTWQEQLQAGEEISPEDKKAASLEKKQELAQWAEENGVEVKYFEYGQRRPGRMTDNHSGMKN